MDGLLKNPDILSFYIASKIPVSVSTRQELLDIDGISNRLRRVIELLDSFNCVRCKTCQVNNSSYCLHALLSSCLLCLAVYLFQCLPHAGSYCNAK